MVHRIALNFEDGVTRFIRANANPQLLRGAITRSGGEVIDFDKLTQ